MTIGSCRMTIPAQEGVRKSSARPACRSFGRSRASGNPGISVVCPRACRQLSGCRVPHDLIFVLPGLGPGIHESLRSLRRVS
jgi:hypothetical protein